MKLCRSELGGSQDRMPSSRFASNALQGMSAWMSTGLLIFRLLSPATPMQVQNLSVLANAAVANRLKSGKEAWQLLGLQHTAGDVCLNVHRPPDLWIVLSPEESQEEFSTDSED